MLSILKALFILSLPVLIPVVVIVFMMFVFFFQYFFIKKMRVPTSDYEKYKKPSFWRRLFIEFPHRYIDDLFNRTPDEFKEHGLHMFCGEQGSGKTTSVVHKLLELQDKYPQCKIRTNMNYSHEHDAITHWKDLVQNDNGVFGQVEVLDEIQTWFSSLQSKDFPPEMITEISQQRKQRKMIIGTAQVFSRIAKPIREQTTYVYLPLTLFGCFTWVRVSKPHYWDDEKQRFKRYIKHYFFIHSEKVRDAFDTYQKIEKYKNEGFKEDKLRIVNE